MSQASSFLALTLCGCVCECVCVCARVGACVCVCVKRTVGFLSSSLHGFTQTQEFSVDQQPYFDNCYERAPVSQTQCSQAEAMIPSIRSPLFTHLTHRDKPRFQMAQSFLQEVVPYRPDTIAGDIAGDFNNLATRAKAATSIRATTSSLSIKRRCSLRTIATPRITPK